MTFDRRPAVPANYRDALSLAPRMEPRQRIESGMIASLRIGRSIRVPRAAVDSFLCDAEQVSRHDSPSPDTPHQPRSPQPRLGGYATCHLRVHPMRPRAALIRHRIAALATANSATPTGRTVPVTAATTPPGALEVDPRAFGEIEQMSAPRRQVHDTRDDGRTCGSGLQEIAAAQ
jgi:hypothetical protein